ncbi:MAG: glycoside hydrolase family 26 protein [Clostridia bacterium]|nr:glycoside hydrolase family 26 protein [Clostridia bacterium]
MMLQVYRDQACTDLLSKLEDLSFEDKFLFGQQNAAHIGVGINAKDGTESDIKNLTGRHPAIVGIDTLSFYGYEGTFDAGVKVVKQLNKEGVIITLSSHMPNFSLGGEGFYDYSPNITDGHVAARILPGGDLNTKYLRFLDKIADFAEACIDVSGNRIPMIFRPFHECNGSWFWWGKDYITDDKFVALFRYTIDYLTENRGIRNFLYAYSPNGPFTSVEEYMSRYPGDDYIDIMGMDFYNDRPKEDDDFWKKFTASLRIVANSARERGKLFAVTETGPRTLDSANDGKYYEGIAPDENTVKDWYMRLLKTIMSDKNIKGITYVFTWANFSETQFWVPYRKADFEHEMVADFLEFVNSGHVLLAP